MRFGYVILIIIKFCELLLWISLRIINVLRSYINHSKECFNRYPNTSKLVKKTRLRLVFSTYSSVFGNLMKHSSSCLIYYDKNKEQQIKKELKLLTITRAALIYRDERASRTKKKYCCTVLCKMTTYQITKTGCSQNKISLQSWILTWG